MILQKGTSFGFLFRIGNDSGPSLNSGQDKAVCKLNGMSLHLYWLTSPTCGVPLGAGGVVAGAEVPASGTWMARVRALLTRGHALILA